MPSAHESYADDEASDTSESLLTVCLSVGINDWARVLTVIEGTQIITKDVDELTKAEVLANKTEVESSQLKELLSFCELDAIVLGTKGSTQNCMTSRWVIRWKMKENKRIITSSEQ